MRRRRKDPRAVALGKKSAKARMRKMTAEQRKEVARTAARARWASKKQKPER